MPVYKRNVASINKTGSTALGGAVTLTGGSNVTLTQTGQDISIAASSGSSMTWTEVTGTSQTMAVNNGYIASNASLVTLTLPATAAVGDLFRIVGKGGGGWKIALASGQTIIWNLGGNTAGINKTTATTGHLDSSDQYDCVDLICITANTTFVVQTAKGSISLT